MRSARLTAKSRRGHDSDKPERPRGTCRKREILIREGKERAFQRAITGAVRGLSQTNTATRAGGELPYAPSRIRDN